jgi:hypothetical protein
MGPSWLLWIPLMSLALVVQAGKPSPSWDERSRDDSAIQGPPAAAEPRDPAYRQYWSDGCRRERAFGYTSSPDCQHPAYSGWGYGPDLGSRWGRGPDTVIINRGGTIIVPQGGYQAAPRQGGSLGGWRR